MAVDTFLKLQSEISDTLNRTDLIADVTEFGGGTIEGAIIRGISKAERRIVRRLRTKEFETSTSFSCVGGTETVNIPSDYVMTKALVLIQGGSVAPLISKDLATLLSDMPSSAVGTPDSFAPYGTYFYLRRIPDSAYQMKLYYYNSPTPLSSTNTSNTLLTKYPDLLLYGALIELTAHVEEDERIQLWKGAFDEAIKDITDDNNLNRWSGVPIRSAVDIRSVI